MGRNILKYLFTVILTVILFANKVYGGGELSACTDAQLDKLCNVYGSKQVIVVAAKKDTDYMAKLNAYERINGQWKSILHDIDTMVGKNGISKEKTEGDKRSPAGIFKLTEAFGTSDKPAGIKLRYTKTTKNHYWIDDATSDDYNKLVYFEGDPYSRWKSFERLTLKCYNHAVVVDYNMNPVIKGKGSAIFLHKFSGQKNGSLGCIEVSEYNLLKILGWLDGDKKPVIVLGTEEVIERELDSLKTGVKVFLDGKELIFEEKPVIVNNRTLVPLRGVFEALDIDVIWDEKLKRITGVKQDMTVVLNIGQTEGYLNGYKIMMDVPAQIINNRTFVPLRFISECTGADVVWNAHNSSVLMSTK